MDGVFALPKLTCCVSSWQHVIECGGYVGVAAFAATIAGVLVNALVVVAVVVVVVSVVALRLLLLLLLFFCVVVLFLLLLLEMLIVLLFACFSYFLVAVRMVVVLQLFVVVAVDAIMSGTIFVVGEPHIDPRRVLAGGIETPSLRSARSERGELEKGQEKEEPK